jgi:hypothetical protein
MDRSWRPASTRCRPTSRCRPAGRTRRPHRTAAARLTPGRTRDSCHRASPGPPLPTSGCSVHAVPSHSRVVAGAAVLGRSPPVTTITSRPGSRAMAANSRAGGPSPSSSSNACPSQVHSSVGRDGPPSMAPLTSTVRWRSGSYTRPKDWPNRSSAGGAALIDGAPASGDAPAVATGSPVVTAGPPQAPRISGAMAARTATPVRMRATSQQACRFVPIRTDRLEGSVARGGGNQ